MSTTFQKTYPEDFREGQRFKDYPESNTVFVIETIDLKEAENVVEVTFSPEGQETTYPWTGRLGKDGTDKSFLYIETEELEQWQHDASVFFVEHEEDSATIAAAIKGLTLQAVERVLAEKPVTWESFSKLTANQMQLVEAHFNKQPVPPVE
jgi:hypothetical protein